MRTTPALRSIAAALLTGGVLTATVAGTSAAATPPNQSVSSGGGHGSPVWGTVVSRGELNVREQPTTRSPVVAALSPGSQDRIQCAVRGQSVFGNTWWYWLVGAQGWASAVYVDTGGQWVPSCQDPCPGWKDRSNWHDASWDNSPFWNRDPCDDSSWSASGSGSFSISGSWSWSVSGSDSGSWEWIPGGR